MSNPSEENAKRYLSFSICTNFLSFVGFWPHKSKHANNLVTFMYLHTTLALVLSILIVLKGLSYCCFNVIHFIRLFSVMSSIFFINAKFVCMSLKKKDLFRIIEFTRNNIINISYNPMDTKIMVACDKYCLKVCITLLLGNQLTVLTYVGYCADDWIKANRTITSFPYEYIFNIPSLFQKTPVYQMLVVHQFAVNYIVGNVYICFDIALLFFITFARGQFEMLHHRMSNIYNESSSYVDISTRLKSCIKEHKISISYVKNVNNLFSIVILTQVVFLSIIICLTVMEGLMIEETANPNIYLKISNMSYTVVAFVQLLSMSILADNILCSSTNLRNYLFHSQWYTVQLKRANRVKSSLLTIIMRTSIPCTLTVGAFGIVTVETFTKVISTAYSYVTLLQTQVNR